MDKPKDKIGIGDLVIITAAISSQGSNRIYLKTVVPVAILRVTSNAGSDGDFIVELRDNNQKYLRSFRLYNDEAEFLCRAVTKVQDVGFKHVCNSCPKQLACLAYQAKRV